MIIIALVLITATIFNIYFIPINNKLETLEEDYIYYKGKYNSLSDDYKEVTSDYSNLKNDYNQLLNDYETLYAPSTLIKNGTINWRFNLLDGSVTTWNYNITSYRSYVQYYKSSKTSSKF